MRSQGLSGEHGKIPGAAAIPSQSWLSGGCQQHQGPAAVDEPGWAQFGQSQSFSFSRHEEADQLQALTLGAAYGERSRLG